MDPGNGAVLRGSTDSLLVVIFVDRSRAKAAVAAGGGDSGKASQRGNGIPSPALPGAGSTGRRRSRVALSASVRLADWLAPRRPKARGEPDLRQAARASLGPRVFFRVSVGKRFAVAHSIVQMETLTFAPATGIGLARRGMAFRSSSARKLLAKCRTTRTN